MNFNKKFEAYSNANLLRIIENANDYQPQAVETAKTILANRQLSENEIGIAKSELETEKQEKSKKEQQKQEIENKVKNVGKSIVSQINPLQKERPTSEKIIRGVSIFFGILFLLQLYRKFGLLRFMFTSHHAEWGFDMVLYFLPLLIILIGTVLFYRRKKAGWLLLAAYLTYSVVLSLVSFILVISWQPSGIGALDALFPPTPAIAYVVISLLFSGIIWSISRENVRIIYSVSQRTAILTIVAIGLLVGGIVIFLF
jgi:hypothetical protein